MRPKRRFSRKVEMDGSQFGLVRSYGTHEVFVSLGWEGEIRAMVATSPGRALKLAKAIIAGVEKERKLRRK